MVNWLNKEILDKVDEIIQNIENSDVYKKYLFLKSQIDNNKELKKLINEVRVLQKDIVHHVKNKKELEEKLNELNTHPLYLEYINTLDEINNIYGIIESNLNNYFNKKLN